MARNDVPVAEVAGATPDDPGDGFVLVLTASADRGLSDDEIARAAEIAGCAGAPFRRLGPAASEIAMPCRNTAGGVDWDGSLPGIDVNRVPARGRRKRLLIADMDSTVIPVECIDELADAAGVGARVAAITERAMRGEVGFEGALRERVGLLAGLPETVLEEVFETRIALNPGARRLVRTMAAHGAHTMLVSGGFTFFTERVGRAAGFAETQANRLVIEGGRLTGAVAEPILGRAAKLAALERGLARFGLDRADALAVGDGANDLAMVEAAGLGVAFRAKPALVEAAGASIRHSGLDALLALQGYASGDWVND